MLTYWFNFSILELFVLGSVKTGKTVKKIIWDTSSIHLKMIDTNVQNSRLVKSVMWAVFVCAVMRVFLCVCVLPLWKCHIRSWVRKQKCHWAAPNERPCSVLLTSLSFSVTSCFAHTLPFSRVCSDKCQHPEEADLCKIFISAVLYPFSDVCFPSGTPTATGTPLHN